MPQYSVTRTGGGLPTSDYAIGLDQAFATAESMRNQRRRNQQAANIMKQTMAAKGLAGTVEVDGEGEINAQADEASLKRFWNTDKLAKGQTTDSALLSWIEQRNDYKKDAESKVQVTSHSQEAMDAAAKMQAEANNSAQGQAFDDIANKAALLAGGTPLSVGRLGVSPTPTITPENAMAILQGNQQTQTPVTQTNGAQLGPVKSPGHVTSRPTATPAVVPPWADPNAPVDTPMQTLQKSLSSGTPTDVEALKAMMDKSGVGLDAMPPEIQDAYNQKMLAAKDLDTQIKLENQKGGGTIDLDGTATGPINDEAMKRIAELQAQKQALSQDSDLVSKIAAIAQAQGQPNAPNPFEATAKAEDGINSIVNPLSLPKGAPVSGTSSGLTLTPSGSGGTEASGTAVGGTVKQGGSQSASQNYEASVDKMALESVKSNDTIVTQSTNGADYQDTMPYSMGTLLAQQGYRDAISAGAGDAVGMQMNPFNSMLKAKIDSISNRNAVAQAANVVNTDVKQGGFEVKMDKVNAKVREGVTAQMSNNTTITQHGPKGGGSQQPEDNDITVGTVVMKKNKDGTITSTDSNISGSEEDVASNAYNNWSKLSETDKAVIRMNGTDKSSLKNALNKVVGKDIYEKTKSSISGKPVRKVEITIEGNKYQVALNSEGGLVPISGQKLPPHFDQKGHGAMGDYFGMLGDKLRSTPDKLKQLEISYMTDDDEMVGSYSPMSNNAKTSGTFPESFSKAIRRSVQLNQTNKSK